SMEAAVLRALFAQNPRQLAGVDAGDAHDVVHREVRAKIASRAEIGHDARQIAYDESRCKGPARFDVLVVHADVADMRTSERDDLAGVGRVSQYFLIPRHRRVENDLADRMASCADGNTAENRAVGEGQD